MVDPILSYAFSQKYIGVIISFQTRNLILFLLWAAVAKFLNYGDMRKGNLVSVTACFLHPFSGVVSSAMSICFTDSLGAVAEHFWQFN